ncbi:MAG: RHS repeat protein [Actinomycetales bacterium]|nr:RHS repeat protein [Actinomycetales bacterium]
MSRALGLTGVVLQVSSSEVPTGSDLAVDVDYSSFAEAVGGDWSSRLHLVALPACAVTTPERLECRQVTSLTGTNDVERSRVTAVVPVAQPRASRAAVRAATTSTTAVSTVLAASASASGTGSGDFTATSLSSASLWKAGTHTGSFTWSYPLRTPPGVNGPSPDLSISYDSGSVDGRTASTNNQTSWVGEGFSLGSGFVERSYVPCAEDMTDGNNKTKTGDLCWKTDNATVSLDGHSGELVKDSATGTWKLKNDDGSRIERKTGATNADNDTEYWVLTTVDGTKYYFGLGKRYSADTLDTKSTLTVPVAGNQSGEPGYKSGDFAGSFLTQAWRWNLDYVVDVHGNTMTYVYSKATNRYRQSATAKSVAYDRDSWLTRIEYGQRKGSEATTTAPARVSFTTAERCVPTADFDCAASNLTSANAAKWPDVPFDQICTSTTDCGLTRTAPTFFTRKRLTAVTTQVLSGTSYTDVDSWALAQKFPQSGDGTSPSLWLSSITQTGKVGGTVTLPAVTFGGTQLPNRVAGLDGSEPLYKWRVSRIDTESGGRIDVSYHAAECTASTLPKPESNTKRCFPNFWTSEGITEPAMTWFNKYPVAKVVESDLGGGSPNKETSYTYEGGTAWHYDDNELTKPKHRTWSQWRGYRTVKVRTGGEDVTNSLTTSTYLRGMDGDHLPSGTRSVSVTDTQGTTVVEAERTDGFLLETISYNGVGGPEIGGTTYTPWVSAATATNGSDTARLRGTAVESKRTLLGDGTTYQRTRINTVFNAKTGLPTRVEDLGDTATATDDLCTRMTYVQNTSANLLTPVARQEKVSVACGATTERPKHVVSDTRTYYDSATSLTATPTRGLATKTEEVSSYTSAGAATYTTTSQSSYDAAGRVISAKDALGRATTTSYTPASGGPVTAMATTNPAGHVTTTTLSPAWGATTAQVDANALRTDVTHDALGRVTAVWLPGTSKAAGATANRKYTYTLSKTGTNAVTAQEKLPNGTYRTSYTLYDGLLRQRQTQEPAHASSGGSVVNETLYDSRGLATEQLGPYWITAAPSTTRFQPSESVPSRTVTVHDGAGRATAEVFYVNDVEKWRTTTSYAGDRVSVDPPAGDTPTTAISDARGRVVELRRYKGAGPSGDYDATTTTYTPDGQRATLTGPPTAAAPNGSVWRYEYDLRGRLVKSTDPVKGVTQTGYDAASQVTSTTDARGRKLFYTYDVLGRRTEEREGSATGTLLVAWTYDTATYGKGKEASATRYVDGKAYVTAVGAYDARGHATSTSVTIPTSEGKLAKTYTTTLAYREDSLGRIVYPAAGDLPTETITYGYATNGDLSNLGGSGTGNYVKGTTRSSYGEPLQYVLGQNTFIWQNFDYENGTRRLKNWSLQRDSATGTDANVTYTYDPAGNITRLADAPTAAGSAGETQCFGYDYLRRLTEAWTATDNCTSTTPSLVSTGPAPYWQSFSYDAAGNRTKDIRHTAAGDTTRTYTYGAGDATQAHTLRKVTQTGAAGARENTYSYDAAGNTTTRTVAGTAQTLAWDAEGHLSSVTEGSGTTGYVYDADGERLIRREPKAVTLYLDGTEVRLDRTTDTVTATRFYTYEGKTIAARNTAGVVFYAADNQGTAQLQINATTNAVTRRRFTPFGDTRGPAPSNWVGDHGYVNGTTDATGLTHLGAREYDTDLGRFISTDPEFDTDDPTSWNGYGYADSNPIAFDDADGRNCHSVESCAAYEKHKKKNKGKWGAGIHGFGETVGEYYRRNVVSITIRRNYNNARTRYTGMGRPSPRPTMTGKPVEVPKPQFDTLPKPSPQTTMPTELAPPPGEMGAGLRTMRYIYRHAVFNFGMCGGLCGNVGFQGGYLTANWGTPGLSTPGASVGWASRPWERRKSHAWSIGGGYIVGGGISVGSEPWEEEDVVWKDVEIDVGIRPVGGYIGPQWSHGWKILPDWDSDRSIMGL